MPLNAPYHSSMEKEVVKAANIINSFFSSTFDADSAIPAEMIQKCAGLAFLTVAKAGFIWTGKLGTGLVVARLEDGSWSAPSGIGTAGVGFGAEIGGEIVDFMIVLGSPSAVRTFKKGTQVSVGAGLDLAIGPVGRAAGANLNAGGGGLSGNYSYSRAKGAFAGIGLHGSTIMVRGEMNSRFYGSEVSPMDILSGHVQPPAGTCDVLYEAIRNASRSKGLSPSSGQGVDAAYPAYGSARNSTSSSGGRGSFGGSVPAAASQRSSTSSSSRTEFTAPVASHSQATPADPNDPRLRRYSSYRSERELYAQFEQQRKSSGAGSSYTPAAATAAAAGATYAASSTYNTQPNASAGYAPASGYAPAAGYAAAPAAPAPAPMAVPPPAPAMPAPAQGYAQPQPIAKYSHPTNPDIKYTSYPAPAPNAHYTPRPQAEALYNSFVKPSSPAPAAQQVPPIPPPATGAEMKEVYTNVINFVSTRCPYANVQVFKDNCRRFGQDQMSLDAFFSYLLSICSHPLMKELVPQLVRLLPTQEKRERLWTQYLRDILLIKI